ncbi:amidase family protein [Sporosarcina highlanderae]|uniref:Amidase family protein n=1 Tax=Sporosarcina highlanderae TaxID=3035916 RepID=A0ABT8JT71_9BACL|nr:amidase family protein [Sporosarcina highlanderae]MDN4608361.1 amidase family protein [Sporosarcina highlanderae]
MNSKLKNSNREWLKEATIRQMLQKMGDLELSSEELVIMYLQRISETDQAVNAILEINPQALQIARSLDDERRSGNVRSLLHGIPVLLKDSMDTADNMHTSCGSLAMKDYFADKDAFLVKKLRDAGAVILGKTNMTEWANFMSDRMRNGWSSRGGQVNNPYGPFDVGGSSSGAAAAIAANMAAVSIGTETSGSIINPSAQNALVGIKPTVGAISRSGIIPLSFTQDTPGPMARTVEDAAITFGQMVGYDHNDPITKGSDRFAGIDWLSLLDSNSLKGKRIGIARSIFEREITTERKAQFDEVLVQLESLGAEIIESIDLGTMEDDLGYDVLLYEFKAALNAYLGKTPMTNPVRTLSDIIRFNKEHSEETLKYGQVMLEKVDRTSGTLKEPAYINALIRNRHLAGELALDRAFDEHRIDMLVFPQDHGCSFSAAAGYPAITVPASFTKEGEPFCITICGRAYSEPELIGYAYAFEQKTKARRSPIL